MFVRVAVIIVMGFIAYGSMLTSPFRVMDDRISIIDNPAIRSLKNVPAIFKEGYFQDRSYYRPLVNLTFMAEYQAFGLNYFFYNLDNLILHILNGLLALLLVWRLTEDEAVSFWTGLLFTIHPVQWEAVCNVPGRSILLSAFFVLSSFFLFLEFYKNGRVFCLPLALVTFFLALLCKESAGVLPLVILAYLASDTTKAWSQKLKSLWPWGAGLAGYLLLREHLGITVLHQASQPSVLVLAFVTFLRSLITDLRLFLFPVGLHYDRCLPLFMSLAQPQAWGTCLFWMVVSVILFTLRRNIAPFCWFLIAWFLLELLPVSQLVTTIETGAGYISTAEHFLYMACVPVFIGMIMAFRRLYELNGRAEFVKPVFLKFAAGGFLVFLFLTAVEQSIYASNEFTMVSRSLSFEPYNPRLQGEMAMLSVFRNDIPDAEKYFRAAIKAEPLNPKYHIGLGTALCQQGKWIEGLEQYVAFDPGNDKDKDLVKREEKLTMTHLRQQLSDGKTFDARGWLAIGIYDAKASRDKEAIEAFLKVVSLDPGQPDAWFDLGSMYEAEGDRAASRKAFQKLLTLPGASPFQKEFVLKHYVGLHQ